jgi:hydrogenase maturation protease
MTPSRILIAGIGNIFLGDDAFGSEVARRLAGRPVPEGVRVVDFGIRGFDLTFALIEGYDTAILVDAIQRDGPPGTLYVIEPETEETAGAVPPNLLIEPHGMDPVKVLRLAAALGSQPRRVLLVGCEPETFGTDEDPALGLSPVVETAVGEAISLIDSLVARLIIEEQERVNSTSAHASSEGGS